MKRLGERIKRKREMMHLQLTDLAKRVGVSASALSQIEKAKATPSIMTLKAIADNLNTTVGELIGENENLSQNPHIAASEIQFVEKNTSGSELYLLSHHDTQKQMETYLIRFTKQSTIDGFILPHQGQQTFCHVKKGRFDFILDETPYELNEGDNFYFDTVLSHRIQLKEGDLGEIVWVTTN